MQAYRQPKNLLRHVSKAAFSTTSSPNHENDPRNESDGLNGPANEQGLFKCGSLKCKLCRLYIQPCKSFLTQNGTEWHIRSRIDCNSLNVLYWLKCMKCDNNNTTTNTGKTFNLRERMNNHISACRIGGSTDLFDEHVFHCKQNNPDPDKEPYFHIYAFMTVKRECLLTYESHLHRKGHDSINSPAQQQQQ